MTRRAIPFSFLWRAYLGRISNDPGLAYRCIANWLCLVFMTFLALVILPRCDIWTTLQFRGPISRTTGTVVGWEYSGIESRSKHGGRSQPLFNVYYAFSPIGGKVLYGNSYALDHHPEQGEHVVVEYRQDNASISRIQGMTVRAFPAECVAVVAFFFPFCLAIFVSSIGSNRRTVKVLEKGVIQTGQVINVQHYIRRNGRSAYKVTVSFPMHSGLLCHAKVDIIRPKDIWLALLDEGSRRHLFGSTAGHVSQTPIDETVLYDPDRPENIVIVDTLPDGAVIGDDRIEDAQPLAQAWLLLIPLAAILLSVGICIVFNGI